MRLGFATRIIAIVAIPLLACCARPARPKAPGSALAAEIDHRVGLCQGDGRSPGVSVALFDEKGITWKGDYGYADRDERIPLSDRTLFEAGSLSKLFTCAAVLQLAERGLVDIDKPLVEYVPEFSIGSRFPSGAEAITPRMLMTHRSGIMADDDAWETTYPERYLYRALLPYLKDKQLLSQPGLAMRYSSFGVNLLGVLIERVSGVEYVEYMRDKVLKPLGMDGASFDYSALRADEVARAYGYNPAWDKIPLDEIRPAGSLRASVEELAGFALMILNGGSREGRAILSPESVAAMTSVQSAEGMDVPGSCMALGFFAETSPAAGGESVVSLYHFGSGRHKAMLIVVPSRKMGIVLCSNDWGVAAKGSDLFADLRGIFMESALGERGGEH